MVDQLNGKLLIVAAPSGTGKSALVAKLKKDFSDIHESISYTTRPKRRGERHGQHYFFVNLEEFETLKLGGELLEWAQVHGHFYGTSKQFVEKQLKKGHFLLFDLDIQGVEAMKRHFGPKAIAVFITPPSMEVLQKRLKKRGTESQENIAIRMANAEKEMLKKDEFDYCFVNDDLEAAYDKLKEIVIKIQKTTVPQ